MCLVHSNHTPNQKVKKTTTGKIYNKPSSIKIKLYLFSYAYSEQLKYQQKVPVED